MRRPAVGDVVKPGLLVIFSLPLLLLLPGETVLLMLFPRSTPFMLLVNELVLARLPAMGLLPTGL